MKRPSASKTPLGIFFSALGRLAESEFAERHGLRDLANRVLHDGVAAGVSVGQQARSRFAAARGLLPDQLLRRRAPSESARFDLTLSDEQELMRETLRRFARDTVRAAAPAADRGALDPGFDEQLADLALETIAIPEAAGGAGETRSPISSALIAEDLAHGDMGLALAALAPLSFVNAVTEFASPAQQGRLLPPFCEPDRPLAALALCEPRARFDPHRLGCVAVREGAAYRLEGRKCLVPLVERAEVFGVFAELAGEGPRIFVVEAQTPGLIRRETGHMGLRAAGLGELELQGVRVTGDAIIGEGAGHDHARAVDLARVGACALALGTCQAALEHVITYCNDRVAFGEPISHRQAVAFMIADMAIELEGMRLFTYRAASRAEQGLSFHREALLARTQCAEKSMKIGSDAVQLLGGHGFVCEHPVERWYRQLRGVGLLEGALLA